jgi:hypothetical protein
MPDLIQTVFDDMPTLANVDGVEYREVRLVYKRDDASGGALIPFASLGGWPETTPGRISTQDAQLAELRALVERQAAEITRLEAEARDRVVLGILPAERRVMEMRARDLDLVAPGDFQIPDALADLAQQDAAQNQALAGDISQALDAERAEQLADTVGPDEEARAALERAFAPAEPEQAEQELAAEPEQAEQELAAEPDGDRVAELHEAIFVTRGISGLNMDEIPVLQLATLPLEYFRFGTVELTPQQLQETIARMLNGAVKTTVLQKMPKFNGSRWGQYTEAYNAIAQRIKPTGARD